MRRLPLPPFDTAQVFTACASTIRDTDCLNRMSDISLEVIRRGGFYDAHAQAGVTYAIPKCGGKNDDLVIGQVTKSELIALYDAGMVNRKLGRAIYDALIVSSSFCPSCGSVGATKNIDHYLPKSSYPWLSICPYNLVPACRDCNTEKGSPVAESAFKQLIHPYYDDECFFNEVWVFAEVAWEDCYGLRYYADPPRHWGALDRARAIHHFEFYGIAEKYSLLAAEHLSLVIDQRKGYFRDVSPFEFEAYLLDIGLSDALSPNDWKGVMYRALGQCVEFTHDSFL
ncbi:HNH endonuclease [Pseudomonas sp. SWRI50]|uniref:HNH endonuclease n=1 Tax=Pseudomonas sp. SWRI50 TaxID=2745484 RepID=UPI001648FAAF|nr:HNH endonuclease [Pseudomonas sp. SWRI50]MBC3487140.1 HNH endonuclease [Pseudomonas sp. SWRI50]